MTQAIASAQTEKHYKVIGQHVVGQLPEGFTRALAYAECEDGASGCDLFFQTGAQVRFAFGSQELTDAFYALWQSMRKEGKEPWRAAVFTLEGNGKFRLNYVYGDRFDETLDATERREPHLAAYFGKAPIDYTPA
jgi:hypothetical protein